ncbi:hypothetical protein Tco_0772964 [Tanacetum coccineum]|uniref:Uncharacterized protein n=1 Tax=Tanacetum coccineum TaxID=301880 RepID=A0ABQ4ZJE1_9ASTR
MLVAYSADQDPYIAYRVTAMMCHPTPGASTIPSPPLPIPSPISPAYVKGSLGSRAAGIRQRDALPVHETEIPEMWLPLRKRLCRTTPGPGCEVGESSAAGAPLDSDRPFHRRTALLIEEEARLFRRAAWGTVDGCRAIKYILRHITVDSDMAQQSENH